MSATFGNGCRNGE